MERPAMNGGSPFDHSISMSMSADEALALRHLLVWLDGVEVERRAAHFTEAELDLLAGLRKLLVEHDFPILRRT